MIFDIITIFPDFFDNFKQTSIIKRAINNNLITINTHDLRKYSKIKGNKVDDTPYGGGCGMLMTFPPFYRAIKYIKKLNSNIDNKNKKVIYVSPQGKLLNNDLVKQLTNYENLIIICGHYEGIDERVMDYVDMEISIGDYVLTGGELAAQVLIDSVSRFVKNVINDDSASMDSLNNGLLKYPQYTKPYKYYNKKVPDVLVSGNHKLINEYREKQSIINTINKRYDLIKKITDENLKNKIIKIEKELKN